MLKKSLYFVIAVWGWTVNASSANKCAFFHTVSRRQCNISNSSSISRRLNQGREDVSDDNLRVIGGGINRLLSRRNILKTIAGTILTIPVVLESYARSGTVHSKLDILQSGQNGKGKSFETWNSQTKDVTIIFHGAGGQDSNTDELLKVLKERCLDNTSSYIKMVDWGRDSENLLQASVKGCKIGATLGQEVKNIIEGGVSPSVQNIHVIGISVGAFPASAMVQELNRALKSSIRRNIYIQLTLLDPFQQKAVLGVNFGRFNFGKGADYAKQYLNTDDPVPSTNDPLPNCATIDVTSLRPNSIFGHDWPLVYYTNELKNIDPCHKKNTKSIDKKEKK
jgi:Lipase.